MRDLGVDPLSVNADHIKLYKGALLKAGITPATIARRLSVLRGTYRQFAEKGLIRWETAQDISAVKAAPQCTSSTDLSCLAVTD
jgi:site-specific recombinase XerC